jgi:LCP family protein required for cell wall assembly
VKVDFDHEQITVVAFPRDLWVKTAGLANQDIDATRLGLTYDEMYHASIGSEKHRVTTATTVVGQALYENFGVAPQTYLTIQMDHWTAMVDGMGGVDIYLPEAFDSDYQMHFGQGMQHLDGEQAKEFVRTYLPGGDDARRQRQTLFAKALQDNLLNAGIVTNLPELADQFSQSIVTDLSPQWIAQLTCMVQAVPKEQISFYEVGGDLVSPRDNGEVIPVLDPKVDQIKEKLRAWLGE